MQKSLSYSLDSWNFRALFIAGLLLFPAAAFTFEHSNQEQFPTRHGRSFGLFRNELRNNLTPETQKVVDNSSSSVVGIGAYKDVPVFSYQYMQIGQIVIMTQEQNGTENRKISSGSGFFISDDGYIMTNKHVVGDPEANFKIDLGGQTHDAEVVYRDPEDDLAILKIEGDGFTSLGLSDSALEIGQTVIAVGNALGRYNDFGTHGTVTSLSSDITIRESRRSVRTLEDLVESTVKLYPGNSGGPLLNLDGHVVGINTATAIEDGRLVAGYSIPVDEAKETIKNAGINI